MSTKPTPGPSLAEYHGQASRLCDFLRITPAPAPGQSKTQAEFDALAAWCAEKQEARRKAREIFGTNNPPKERTNP